MMCMVEYADCDGMMFGVTKQIARKPHKCGECYRHIEAGETYHRATGIQDGEFWSGKQCAHCAAASNLLMKECDGFLYGGVMEDLEEHIREVLPWSMKAARYVIAMRRGWKRFHGGMMPIPENAP